MKLAFELAEIIRDHGPITVADYMARCNAHYYATRDPLGAKGDFTTAPEISQIFGELLGAWAADSWERLGRRQSVLCELGPGRGTLLKDALRATRNVAGFHDSLTVQLMETSPALKEIQESTLAGAHSRITWHEALALPPLPLLLIANEFFDALPTRQYVGDIERKVAHDGIRLGFTPESEVTRETSPASLEVMRRIAAHIRLHGGAALIIDYGYSHPSPRKGEGISRDTLQAVKRHVYVDPLLDPGEADLTAHVDFAALAEAAHTAGVQVHGPIEQGTFLKRLGAELRATALCKNAAPEQRDAILSGLERLVAPHQMGELFKVISITSSLEALAGF